MVTASIYLLVIKTRVTNFRTLVWDLRFFVILQTFLLLSYIRLKPRVFCTPYPNTTSKHSRIQKFWPYFANKILWLQTKTGKAPPPSWLLLCLGMPMACGSTYRWALCKVSRLFLNTVSVTLIKTVDLEKRLCISSIGCCFIYISWKHRCCFEIIFVIEE